MSIFQPCEGGVYKVENDCADYGSSGKPVVTIDTMGGVANVAYTGFMLQLHTNQQFLHALDEFIYVFPFGDRIGEFTLTGITFLGGGKCPDVDAGGICSIYNYYINNRLGIKTGRKPSVITIGGCSPPLLGFLTGLRMETLRPEMPLVQWVLRFNVIIQKQ